MRLARQLAAEGKTVVMVLHELNLALRFADRVALLENGAVRAEGAPDGIAGCGALEQVFGVCAQPSAGSKRRDAVPVLANGAPRAGKGDTHR